VDETVSAVERALGSVSVSGSASASER
jgi:hypothetical protein